MSDGHYCYAHYTSEKLLSISSVKHRPVHLAHERVTPVDSHDAAFAEDGEPIVLVPGITAASRTKETWDDLRLHGNLAKGPQAP
ncbi:hypothetical protein RI367_008174 [Sorochytrium milnesiophthora]